MLKLDHLRIPVTNVARSRDWYVRTLGMKSRTSRPSSPSGRRGASSSPTAHAARTGDTAPSSPIPTATWSGSGTSAPWRSS